MQISRLGDGPIIDASTCDSIGVNIQGPSLVRMPDWATSRLGRYHLYFADHKGAHIRLAHADQLVGPWTVHRPGSLQLAHSHFLTEPPSASAGQLETIRDRFRRAFGDEYDLDEATTDATVPHIASPDVHVDHEHRRFVMYFHGLEALGRQVTRAATSTDGISFRARSEVLGGPYFRVFHHDGWFYALVMPGRMLRSRDGLTGFEAGPTLFQPEMRHSAVAVRGDTLHVLWTRVGDTPESILHSTIDLTADWHTWRESAPQPVLRPELAWEGAFEPAAPSRRGAVHGVVNQLRDPCVFEDDGRTWLLYSGGGESAIGIAALAW